MSNFNVINAQQCLAALEKKPKKILIVGCGDHCEDVKAFNDLLDNDVIIHGVDILDNVGEHYRVDNVFYMKSSIADFPGRSEYYDLAYSFASFEHIKDLRAGWQNMLDTLKVGGTLWCISSPLWMSPWGHHKRDMFEKYPYIHLKYQTPDTLLEFCKANDILPLDGVEMIHHVNYMLSDQWFNKLNSKSYLEAVAALKNCMVVKNDFDLLSEDTLSSCQDLLEAGFSKEDLISHTHRLCLTKIKV